MVMLQKMDDGEQCGSFWIEEINGEVQNPVRKKRKYKSKKKEYIGWGSTSLIEFLESIGRDTSNKISQNDVTQIINDYVKQNDLVNPVKKKRILCDTRLNLLFGRKSIGRLMISDLLESHFLENCEQSDDDLMFDSEDDEYAIETPTPTPSERRSQPRKHVVEKPKSRFAAINPFNIKLVYLKRSLIEELLKDLETFETKVVGSFIRIKCDPNDYLQKNSHQLLQITDIKKSSGVDGEIRFKASGFIKDISINMLSDDNFSEAECEDLLKRVKDGLLERPLIMDFEEKARVLHEDMTKHWLAVELALLHNLIDRANEKGWRRELSGYLQKRDKLKSPEELERLLHEIPEVIAEDPESESMIPGVPVKKLETSFQEFSETTYTEASLATEVPKAVADDFSDEFSDEEEWLFHGIPQVTTGYLDFSESETPEVPDEKAENNIQGFWEATCAKKYLVTKQENESPKSILSPGGPSEVPLFSMEINNTALNSISRDTSAVHQWSSMSVQQQPAKQTDLTYKKDGISMPAKSNEVKIGAEISQSPTDNQVRPAQIEVIELSDDDDEEESEKLSTIKPVPEKLIPVPAELQSLMWHYRDPQGHVQGPFSIVSLKCWSDARYFSPDFKVWRAGQSQDQSVLLVNILPKFFPHG